MEFIQGAELVIHNAPFDVKFLNYEFKLTKNDFKSVTDHCGIVDTLILARQKHPGQQNNLDALCRRYQVDNSDREYHGALLDAKLLTEVYLAMTGGQASFFVDKNSQETVAQNTMAPVYLERNQSLPIIQATDAETAAHLQRLEALKVSSGGKCVWLLDEDH